MKEWKLQIDRCLDTCLNLSMFAYHYTVYSIPSPYFSYLILLYMLWWLRQMVFFVYTHPNFFPHFSPIIATLFVLGNVCSPIHRGMKGTVIDLSPEPHDSAVGENKCLEKAPNHLEDIVCIPEYSFAWCLFHSYF